MINRKIKKRNILIFIFLIIYKFLLDISYVRFVYKLYNYMGFTLDFNLFKYLFSILFFIVIFLILPKDKDKPSSIFLQLHLIIIIMPMLTIYAFMNESTVFFILSMLVFIFECIMLRWLPRVKIPRIKNSKRILYLMLIGITVFVYFSMLKANGIPSLKALDISNVYSIRGTVEYPFLMSYLVNWQAKVINPFLITTAYLNKNKKLFILSITLQIVLYLITAHKSYLLIPLAILFVIKVVEKWDFLKISSLSAAVGVIFLMISYYVSQSLVLASLFLRRLLFVPAQIKFYYYDFFSENEFMYFSQGTIGKIFGLDYPYEMNSAKIIGEIYFGSPDTNANTGYIADAYANMGIFGMFIIALLFILILVLIDSLSIKVGRELTIGLSIFSILALNDVALLTTLLTGGMLFLLVILYLYSNFKRNESI